MTTSKDVAALAGVSHATVSRVFRNEPSVSEKTRKKVLEAAEILQYQPDPMASVLKRRASNTISFLNPYPDNPFYMRHIFRISNLLFEQYGYKSLMIPNTNYEERAVESIKLLLSYHVDGIIFSPIQMTNQKKNEIENLILNETHCKFLQLHSKWLDSVDAIYYDDYHTMYRLVNTLFDNGHKKILLVSDDGLRASAFLAAYRDRHMEEYLYTNSFFDDFPSADGISAIIQTYQPTAVVAIAQMFALPTLEALTKLSLRFPEDISFIVYDESPWLKALGITSVSHDEDMAVKCAVDRIHGLITGEYKKTEHLIVPSVILYRKSFMPNVQGNMSD